jgi:hypothetical protein
VLSPATARRLQDAGLAWAPARGDRFVVADRDMDDEVFVVSDMVIEHHRAPTGGLLRFNGTTEWALDSLDVDRALWLPREDQLRGALGAAFTSLTRVPGGWRVSLVDDSSDDSSDDGASEYVHPDAEEAYAAALLDRLTRPGSGPRSTSADR